MSRIDDAYLRASRRLTGAAGEVANYCDSVEHNEAAETSWVIEAGATLRQVAADLAAAIGEDLVELYAVRLAQIEQRGLAGALPGAFDGPAKARKAATWLDLQLVQAQHDRHYHPDVAGHRLSGTPDNTSYPEFRIILSRPPRGQLSAHPAGPRG